jgi:hypothetical protein
MNVLKQLHLNLKRLAAARGGTSAVELALCLPLVAGMIVPLTDLGMGAYTQMQVVSAAQAGAMYAAQSGFNSAAITTAVTNATGLGAITATPAPSQSCECISGTNITAAVPAGGPPCTQVCASGTAGTFVTVSAQATYTTLFDYTPIVPHTVTLTSQAVIRIK